MTEKQPQTTLEAIALRAGFASVTRYDAWLSWQYATGTRDRDQFERSYVGHFATRAAIGEHLLHEYGAAERLVTLPHWLRHYVQLDGSAFAADFEADGLLLVLNRVTANGGLFAYRPESSSEASEGVVIPQRIGT